MKRAVCRMPAAGCAMVLVYLASREPLNYDSLWHVWICRQDRWSRFWFEVGDNAHPPLFYLVLEAVMPLGHQLLVYRIPSIVST